MELTVKRKTTTYLISAVLALGIGSAAKAAELTPDVSASVWEENGKQCAAVTFNGKEVIAFHGTAGRNVEDKAEDLAEKLQALVEDQKFDPQKLLPAREGEQAVIRVDGNPILKFEPDTDTNRSGSVVEQSWRIVNALRAAYGARVLPETFLTLVEPGHEAVATKSPNWFSGAASYYGEKFHGRKCSDGSRFNMWAMTAAHRWLPFGTRLLVMNRRTGQSCVVQVNDRGPFVDGRVIDLSQGAAKELNMLGSGLAIVDCLVLGNQ